MISVISTFGSKDRGPDQAFEQVGRRLNRISDDSLPRVVRDPAELRHDDFKPSNQVPIRERS